MKGYADDIHEEGFAPLRELMTNYAGAGGTVYVCSPCFKKRGLDEAALVPGAKIVGGAKLVELLDEPVLSEVVFGRPATQRSFMCGALGARGRPEDELALAEHLLARALPDDKRIGVGVVNQKRPHIEPVDEIIARAEAAIRLFGPERVLLHPDRGFATFADNPPRPGRRRRSSPPSPRRPASCGPGISASIDHFPRMRVDWAP